MMKCLKSVYLFYWDDVWFRSFCVVFFGVIVVNE